MTDQLVIRIPAEAGELSSNSIVEWILFDDQCEIIKRKRTQISEIYGAIEDSSDDFAVDIIVPGSDVLLCTASIPSKKISQIKQALPFIIEELIADEIENVHMAIPEPLDLDIGIIDVAIITHQILINYLDVFYSNRLSPNFITPDILTIPYTHNNWSLVNDDSQCILRTGELSGIVSSPDDMEMILASLFSEDENTSSERFLEVISSNEDDKGKQFSINVANYIRENYAHISVKETVYREPISELISSTLVRALPELKVGKTINLLQGGYRINSQQGNVWQYWRTVASVAAVGICVFLIFSLGNGWYFSEKATQFDSQSIVLYKKLFPNERRIVSPRKQFDNHLKQLNNSHSSSSFLYLLTKMSESMSTESLRTSLASDKISIQKLRYDQNTDGIQLEIQTESIEQLDQIKNNLSEIGLSTTVNSASEQDTYVLSRVLVERL